MKPRSFRTQLEAKGNGFAVVRRALSLLGHPFAIAVEHLGGNGSALVAGRQHLSLNRDGGVLEGRLADRDLLQGNVLDGVVASDDHRINRRQAGDLQLALRQISRVAVGQDQHAGDRLAAVAVRNRAQRRAHRRGAAVKRQLGIILGGV